MNCVSGERDRCEAERSVWRTAVDLARDDNTNYEMENRISRGNS